MGIETFEKEIKSKVSNINPEQGPDESSSFYCRSARRIAC